MFYRATNLLHPRWHWLWQWKWPPMSSCKGQMWGFQGWVQERFLPNHCLARPHILHRSLWGEGSRLFKPNRSVKNSLGGIHLCAHIDVDEDVVFNQHLSTKAGVEARLGDIDGIITELIQRSATDILYVLFKTWLTSRRVQYQSEGKEDAIQHWSNNCGDTTQISVNKHIQLVPVPITYRDVEFALIFWRVAIRVTNQRGLPMIVDVVPADSDIITSLKELIRGYRNLISNSIRGWYQWRRHIHPAKI